jgi:hypothetical protein
VICIECSQLLSFFPLHQFPQRHFAFDIIQLINQSHVPWTSNKNIVNVFNVRCSLLHFVASHVGADSYDTTNTTLSRYHRKLKQLKIEVGVREG